MSAKLVRLADYVMDFLAARGVRHVFLLPGGGAMHLNDALAQQPDIAAVHCHHEQACGIAAEAYGRLAERTGVAMVTTGPGATNILTPVAGAWIESLPLLVISGQVKRADLLQGSGLRQKGVQEVDVVSMAKPVTKYAVTVTDPQAIRQHLEEALYLAHSGRPGRCGWTSRWTCRPRPSIRPRCRAGNRKAKPRRPRKTMSPPSPIC
ncbi:Acetolactate synthase large subunit [Chromobacterium violaceum]|uniref:Acetolactate synthase large subunit n=1 Tax=Chromobacterium violaceum TaxID=536 RepID=A0A3S4HQR0_CHRVL|nr:Acetolactate synthase large subunit [Chromobacterium violaceum]